MYYTPKIQQALTLAIDAHKYQSRKEGEHVAFISHPLAVALILARANASEDIICAALLHDVVEDAPKELGYDLLYIEKHFGQEVHDLVEHVTEKDKSLPWQIRKQLALEHIKDMPQDALLLKTADQLHNATDMLLHCNTKGTAYIEQVFSRGIDVLIPRIVTLYKEIARAWPNNPLLPEYNQAITRLESFLE